MQGKNKHLFRYLEAGIASLIKKRYSCLLLGARQTGKTTLVNTVLQNVDNKAVYLLQEPSLRREFEVEPSRLITQVRALPEHPYVFVDEAQKVPEIFDAAQILLDTKEAQFILTGSSARKLKRANINLLPGRLKRFYLTPLLWGELGLLKGNALENLSLQNINVNPGYSFEDTLIYGALPGIVLLPKEDRQDFLSAYAGTYLEEEIRAEALSRKIGAFSRFLELAAAESGTAPNFTKLSYESGVTQPAIKEFYHLLEDTLIAERVEPYSRNARKRIFLSSRYYFFDIGVRNILARLPLTRELINAQRGILFEHAVILEIARRIKTLNKNYRVCYWRTSAGAEVDCVIDCGDVAIPIEIKSSGRVSLSELKGLRNFLSDYKTAARQGYVVTMGGRKEKLAENILAVPWFEL